MATTEGTARFTDLKARLHADEPRRVQVWRRELQDDLARVSAALDGLQARVVALDNAKARIDRPTADALNALGERLNDIVGSARYEGVTYDDAGVATDDEAPADDAERAEDALSAVFAVGALVHALAERLHGHGSLGVGERGGHDHALFQLLERQCEAAVRAASEATR